MHRLAVLLILFLANTTNQDQERMLGLFFTEQLNMYFRTSLINIILPFIFINSLSCTPQADEESFSDWDTNADTFLDEEEFSKAFLASDFVSDLELQEAEGFTYGDLYDVYFHIWDFDNDDALGRQEWQSAVDTYFENYDEVLYGEFDDWDLDDSDQITKNEYMEAVLDTGLFETWDMNQDAMISEEEFAQGIYEYWDTDGDGYIEAVEYEEWEPVYSDI